MATRRQEIAALLERGEWTFDELRRELGLSVATLRGDLRHVERSLRPTPRRLRVTQARCPACGHRLTLKPGRYAAPSRCPRCKSERILPPLLSLD